MKKLRTEPEYCLSSCCVRHWLHVSDGVLFAWSPRDCCLMADDLETPTADYQTLIPANPPTFDVHRLVFNSSGKLVALVGSKGLSVMQLPRRWGEGMKFEGGKSTILCKTIPVGSRLFASHGKLEVLQVLWHPGSDSDTHLAVLDSENCFWIFNVYGPSDAVHVHPLGSGSTLSSSTQPSLLSCLGDTAVAFSFGAPLGLSKNAAGAVCWPAFVLRGNGDIYLLYTSLEEHSNSYYAQNANPTTFRRSVVGRIRGPLIMHPPAEDNYGVDACSILCLATVPPILVVATSSGTLYHCLVLAKGDEEGPTSPEQMTSTPRWSSSDEVPDVALYVFESVELELSLTTLSLETGDIEEDNYTCPIHLLPDPTCSMRYHCSHAAGVHTVALPIVSHLEQFAEKEDEIIENLLPLIQDQECIVEHLICTKPLNNSPAAPVLGVALCSDPKGSTVLFSLTSDLEIVVLCLAPFYLVMPLPMIAENQDASMISMSPLHCQAAESFDTHIRKQLQRSVSNPVLKSSASADLTPQEGLQLLGRATQILREEYIQRLELVHNEIQRRVKTLKELKNHQLENLKSVEGSKKDLTSHAQELAERYEDAKDKQALLNSRVKEVLKKVQRNLPMLSEAERGMKKEMSSIRINLNELENSLKQVKIKSKIHVRCQEGMISHSSSASKDYGELSEGRKKQLQDVLKTQSEELNDLVKRMSLMKQQLNV